MTKENNKRPIIPRIQRTDVIGLIYSFEVMDERIDTNQLFLQYPELDEKMLQMLGFIAKNYNFFKKNIEQQLNLMWNWERILPLLRSILLFGCAEIFFLAHQIVINEMIEITKLFTLETDNDHKFVNAILQKIYLEFKEQGFFQQQINYNDLLETSND